jgi:hypothetical protein
MQKKFVHWLGARDYYYAILGCAHLNLWICSLLKIEWCLWWTFDIYHEDQWLLLYSIPWSLLLPALNIFAMLKGVSSICYDWYYCAIFLCICTNLIVILKKSRTASKICLSIHYFFSILQISYCICETIRYKKVEPNYLYYLLGLYILS